LCRGEKAREKEAGKMEQILVGRLEIPMQWVKVGTTAWHLWTLLGWLTLDVTKDGYAAMAQVPATL
jgi:hypothetical protein